MNAQLNRISPTEASLRLWAAHRRDKALALIRCLEVYDLHKARSPQLTRELWLTLLLAGQSLNDCTGRAL
jgi:hypothetical protein